MDNHDFIISVKLIKKCCIILKLFVFLPMERKIIYFGDFFKDFIKSLNKDVREKIDYVLDMLKRVKRLNPKFIKHIKDGLFELRIEWEGNIYRVFFVFDEGNIVVLFNGFQKKSQKTPIKEIEKALRIKKEYYEYRKQHASQLR